MRRQIEKTLLILLGIGAAVIPIRSQTNPQKPSYEVASVKPYSATLNGMRGGGTRGDRLTLSGVALRLLMNMAYGGSNWYPSGGPEIFGAPDWMDSALFDVEAKADCGGEIISSDQQALMVQSMLEDRFQLKLHVETRDMPVYNLVVGKDGPKLKSSADQSPPASFQPLGQLCGSVPDTPPAPAPSLPRPAAGISQMSVPRGAMLVLAGGAPQAQAGAATLRGSAISIRQLASSLKSFTGRKVINKTGLTGLFDIALKFSTDGMASNPGMPAGAAVNGAPVAAEPVPTLFSAIQELGLRLGPARGPVQVIVIDSVQKPSEN